MTGHKKTDELQIASDRTSIAGLEEQHFSKFKLPTKHHIATTFQSQDKLRCYKLQIKITKAC